MAEPAEVLARLAADLAEVLGDDLSLALHGSSALGDFAPGRSDLDVLAVVVTDPTAATLAELDDVHARLDTDFPEWNGHVEVDYISAEAVQAALQGTDESHPMIRISPGEPLHEVEASRHYVLKWAAALQADQPIAGAAPSAVCLPSTGDSSTRWSSNTSGSARRISRPAPPPAGGRPTAEARCRSRCRSGLRPWPTTAGCSWSPTSPSSSHACSPA